MRALMEVTKATLRTTWKFALVGFILGGLMGALMAQADPKFGGRVLSALLGAAIVGGYTLIPAGIIGVFVGVIRALVARSTTPTVPPGYPPHQPSATPPWPPAAMQPSLQQQPGPSRGPAGPAPETTPLAPVAPAPSPPPAPERVDLQDPERLNRVLARLDGLIGLESVAKQVRAVAQRVAFEVRRAAELGVERSEIGMHAVFTGPPGVGKTEVARIWGEVLCALGLLPRDKVVEVGRQDLVAPHIGETAPKTRAKLEEARGGVFFLDEAYALVAQTEKDFGPEAIAEIMTFMENQRDAVCVIVAGYEQEMEEFLNTNTGLASRFSETIHFPSYDAATLVQVTKNMAAEGHDTVTAEALDLLDRAYRRLVASPPQGWANARSARQVLDVIRTARAERVGTGELDHETMTTLTAHDVQAGISRKYPQEI